MKEYYVEVYFPPFPNKGRKVRVVARRCGTLAGLRGGGAGADRRASGRHHAGAAVD